MRRAVALLRCARGYSLVELLTVTIVLVTILTALTTLFVSGAKKEIDLNARVGAQLEAVAALDRLRRDVHCAGTATSPSASAITLDGCSTGTVNWCVVGSGTRYGLYRTTGLTTCDATGRLYADYLTSPNVFAYTPSASTSLAFVSVDLQVNTHTAQAEHAFRLTDTIVLRNSLRA